MREPLPKTRIKESGAMRGGTGKDLYDGIRSFAHFGA